jgi:hypothetical protein
MKTKAPQLAVGVFLSLCTAACGTDGKDGINGTNGTNGRDGTNGTNGSSCSVASNADGSKTISCTNGTSATIGSGQGGTVAPLHVWSCPAKSKLIVDTITVSGCTIAASAGGMEIWDLGGAYFLSCNSFSQTSCTSGIYDSIGDFGDVWAPKSGATTLDCVPQGAALGALFYEYTIATSTVAYINTTTYATLATALCTQLY